MQIVIPKITDGGLVCVKLLHFALDVVLHNIGICGAFALPDQKRHFIIA